MKQKEKLYKVIFWRDESKNTIAERAEIWALNVEEADTKFFEIYGKVAVRSIFNEEEENMPR